MRNEFTNSPNSEMPKILKELIFDSENVSKNILEFELPTHYSQKFEDNFRQVLKAKRVLLHVDFTLEAVCCAVLLYKILKQNGVSPYINFATRESEGFGNQFKILLSSSKLKNVDFVLVCGFSQKPEIPNCIHFAQKEEIFSENPITLIWRLSQNLKLEIENELPFLLAFQNGFTALVGSNFQAFLGLNEKNLKIQIKEFCFYVKKIFEEFQVDEKVPIAFEEELKFFVKILVNSLRFGRSELVFKILSENKESKQFQNCLKILVQKFLARKRLVKSFEENLQNGKFSFYDNEEVDFCVLEGSFELGFLRIFARDLANKSGKNVILISTKIKNEKIGTIFGLDSFKRNFFDNFEVYFKSKRLTVFKCWFKLRGVSGKEIFEILRQF